MNKRVYQVLASRLVAIKNCAKTNNMTWEKRHGEVVRKIMASAPSGSGFDSGTELLTDRCTATKLMFSCEFHHMDDAGYYDGWTAHEIIVTPTFDGIDVRVTGRDRNMVKDYIGDVYYNWLTSEWKD